MEKMKYERPVMKAELFQANDHVAICHITPYTKLLVEWNRFGYGNSVTGWLGNFSSTGYVHEWTGGVIDGGLFGNLNNYDTKLEFEGQATKIGDTDSYYWTTTGDGVDNYSDSRKTGTYYLYAANDSYAEKGMFELYWDGNNGDNVLNTSSDKRFAWATVVTDTDYPVVGS